MIVHVKRNRDSLYKVTVWSSNGFPITTYSEVAVFIDDKPAEDDELVVEATIVRYLREKKEVRIYTKPRGF